MSNEVKMAHELFLPESDEHPIIGEADIGAISVERTAPHKENAGTTFSPAQLPNPAALHAMFGGGSYTVKARDQARQIMKGGTRYYTFSGEPRPMDGSAPKTKEAPAAPAAPHYPYPAPPAPIDLTPLATMMASAQQQNTALLQTMMQTNAQTIQAIMGQRATPSGGEGENGGVAHLLEGYKLGLSSLEEVMKAKEEGRQEGQAMAQSSGSDDIGATIKTVAEAIGTVQSMNASRGKSGAPLIKLPGGKKEEKASP